jgi:hypothetical protein
MYRMSARQVGGERGQRNRLKESDLPSAKKLGEKVYFGYALPS